VPVASRKAASHCGGVPPQLPWLAAFPDTPMVADPGNRVYGKIVRRLLDEVPAEQLLGVSQWGLYNLRCWRRNIR
jgi:hypothetical protein